MGSPLADACWDVTLQALNCATGLTCWLTLADPSPSGTHCRKFQRNLNLILKPCSSLEKTLFLKGFEDL